MANGSSNKINSVVRWTAIAVIFGLNTTSWAHADYKSELNSLTRQRNELAKEIQEKKADLQTHQDALKDLESNLPSGDCSQACMPADKNSQGNGSCSPQDFLTLFPAIKEEDLDVRKLERQASITGTKGTACEILYYGYNEDVSALPCHQKIMNCAKVAIAKERKLQEIAKKSLQRDLDRMTSELASLRSQEQDLRASCKDCDLIEAAKPKTPGIGDYIVAGLQAVTPAVLGGLQSYNLAQGYASYEKNYNSFLGSYNSYLGQCATIGVPCQGPPMAGGGFGVGYGGGGFGTSFGSGFGSGFGVGVGSPFGGGFGASPFGASPFGGGGIGLNVGFGGSPFGGSPFGAMGGSPFGGGFAMGGSPFGGSPFGGGMGLYNPYFSQGAQMTAGYGMPNYPIGTGFGSNLFPFGAMGGSPFGGGGGVGLNIGLGGSPFGGSPFGAMGGSPFGGGYSSPFGGGFGGSPFGYGASPFGGGGYSSFGGSPYGNFGGSPYGYGSSPYGGFGGASPFGGGYSGGAGYYNPTMGMGYDNSAYMASYQASMNQQMLNAQRAQQSQQDQMLAQQQLMEAYQRASMTYQQGYSLYGGYGNSGGLGGVGTGTGSRF